MGARECTVSARRRVTVQATAASTPFAVDGFDAVMLLGVLSVVDDRTSVVREARRLGRLVGVLDYCSASSETLCVAGSRFPSVDELTAEMASAWEQVSVMRVTNRLRLRGIGLPNVPTTVFRSRAVSSRSSTRSRRRLVAHALVGR